MYSVNGVALDNPTFGWSLRAPSKPLSELVQKVDQIYVPGRSGVVSIGAPMDAPVLPLMVQTPRENLETLYAIFMQPNGTLSITADPSRSVAFQYMSASLTGYGDADAVVDVVFSIRLDGAFWRDAEVGTTAATNLITGVVNADVFAGLSAPIEDALVKIIGPVSAGVRVTDWASQASLIYSTAIPSGSALVYDCADETAQIVTTVSNWTAGTDVSGQVSFYGDRFKITPFMPDTEDPTTRVGRLNVTASGVTSGTSKVQVQGRGAYLV